MLQAGQGEKSLAREDMHSQQKRFVWLSGAPRANHNHSVLHRHLHYQHCVAHQYRKQGSARSTKTQPERTVKHEDQVDAVLGRTHL